jgi:hypothetical protein
VGCHPLPGDFEGCAPPLSGGLLQALIDGVLGTFLRGDDRGGDGDDHALELGRASPVVGDVLSGGGARAPSVLVHADRVTGIVAVSIADVLGMARLGRGRPIVGVATRRGKREQK